MLQKKGLCEKPPKFKPHKKIEVNYMYLVFGKHGYKTIQPALASHCLSMLSNQGH